jgi:hypothetical protein
LQRRYVCTTRMDVFRFTEHFTCHDDVQINKCVHTTMYTYRSGKVTVKECVMGLYLCFCSSTYICSSMYVSGNVQLLLEFYNPLWFQLFTYTNVHTPTAATTCSKNTILDTDKLLLDEQSIITYPVASSFPLAPLHITHSSCTMASNTDGSFWQSNRG